MIKPRYSDKKKFSCEEVGSSELYLLSWIDAIERLDILLLEARHLQISIINDLREPALLMPLRYEEKHLWGDEWGDFLKVKSPKHLAQQWVIPFPDRKVNINKDEIFDSLIDDNATKSEFENISDRLNILIDTVWHRGGWGKEQRSNYYSLRAIQLLKREIIRDKLELSYHALFISNLQQFTPENPDEHSLGVRDNNKRAEFMILRGAILHQASKDYVERMRDYQYQFSKSVDTFIDDTAWLNKYRRRDLGVYTDFLRDRTLGIYNEMDHLFEHLGVPDTNDKEALVLHNWMHSYTSRSHHYKNPVSEFNVTHITTNYWMPERPDLQPIIAHEIAHQFVTSRLGDIDHATMPYLHDDFSLLLLRIYAKADDFSKNSFNITLNPKSIVRELSCDFLASSIKGIRYIYAHFLELLGNDISFFGTLTRNGKDIDYENLGHLSYGQLDEFYDNRMWYLRIKLTLIWLTKIHHTKNSRLDHELIDGIHKIIDDILDLYKSLATNDIDSKREFFWEELTNQLSEIICSSDQVVATIRDWRRERSNDVFDKRTGQKKKHPKFPRSVARIDIRVRDALYMKQLSMKTKKGRLLHGFHSDDVLDIKKAFAEYYTVGHDCLKKNINPDTTQDDGGPLYRYIYDIIWQSSLMRAKDLLFQAEQENSGISGDLIPKKNKTSEILKAIHDEFPMGRDLFSFALEFSLFDNDSPHDRLMTISHLLDDWLKNNRNSNFYKELYDWYYGSPSPPYNNSLKSADCLLKSIKATKRGSSKHRAWNKEIGRKLKFLFEDILKKRKKYLDSELLPLFYFLKTKQKQKTTNGAKRIPKNSFHSIILSGFELNNNENISSETTYLIGKISLSGSYSQLRERAYKLPANPREQFKDATHNSLRQDKVFLPEGGAWNGNNGADEDCNYITHLGRYDILLIKPATSLCRCRLPAFSLINDTKNVVDEKFPSYFLRREMAIPFRLGRKPWDHTSTKNRTLVILNIKLKQRSLRLNFLYRLRNACLNPSRHTKTSKNVLETVADNFQILTQEEINNPHNNSYVEDCAFLIDGSDDIILMFMSKNTQDNSSSNNPAICGRLHEILEIQNCIYEDFMVDRTRLTFRHDCLKAIKVEPQNFKAILSIRLLEDRHLNLSNSEYLMSKEEKTHIKFFKTPGEYDYYADITEEIKRTDKSLPINTTINELSDSKYIDSINTQILHLESKKMK